MYSSRGRGGGRRNSSYLRQASRARPDDLDGRYVKPTTKYPAAGRRMEDWRLPCFTRHSDTMNNTSYGPWKSDDSKFGRPACKPLRKEYDPSRKRYEDWRNENSWRSRSSPMPKIITTEISAGSVGSKASMSSNIREWPENSYGKGYSPFPKSCGSIKGLNEAELEQAARLQLKLMAEMEGSVGKVNYISEKKKEHSNSEDSIGGYHIFVEREMKDASATVSNSKHRPVNTLETSVVYTNPPSDKDERCRKENESSNLDNGGLVGHANNFEETRMLARNSESNATSMYKPKPKEENWYEDYWKNMGKVNTELHPSLPRPNHVGPSSATFDMQQSKASRSCLLGNGSDSRNHLTMSDSSSRSPGIPKERELNLLSKSSSIIDPNQYVEEISESEDWDEIAQIVCKSKLKRPPDSSSEQPHKRSLLDLPNDLSSPYSAGGKSQNLQHSGSVAASGGAEMRSTELKSQSQCPPTEEKSCFRIEYPTMQQGTYLSQPPYGHWRRKEAEFPTGALDYSKKAKHHQNRLLQ